MICP